VRPFIIAFLVITLSACGNEKQSEVEKPEVRDVSYFLNHPEERKEVFEECKNNPGELGGTPECKNAFAANKEALLDELQKSLNK